MIRWGVLSTGSIADIVVGANRGSALSRFDAVASRDVAKARDFAQKHGVAHAFGSYEELLASDVIDAVYVALPVSLHTEWTIKALEAGKDVLCEKPYTTSLVEAEATARAVRSSGRRFAEGFMWRFHPQTTLVRDLLAAGAIGELSTVRAALSVDVPAGDIRRTTELGGGALGDLGGYCVSAIRLFAGDPRTVFAQALSEDDGLDRRLVGTTQSPSGVLGLFDVGLDLAARRDELELIGTAGVIRVSDPWVGRSDAVEVRTADGGRTVAVPGATGPDEPATYRHEFDTVSAAWAAGTDVEFDVTDTYEQAAVMAALLDSLRTGRPQTPGLLPNHEKAGVA